MDHASVWVFCQRGLDGGKIESAGGSEFYLTIADVKISKATSQAIIGTAAHSDDLLKCVIWCPTHTEQCVAWSQNSEQGAGNCVCAREHLHPHKRLLGAHELSDNLIERLTANITMTIAIHTGKMPGTHSVMPEGVQHAGEPAFRPSINGRERWLQSLNRILYQLHCFCTLCSKAVRVRDVGVHGFGGKGISGEQVGGKRCSWPTKAGIQLLRW
mmetsp:Transcript_82138/g.154886  ORF Transcript_82138/g.154886 Transcript_82138/m.154886 type:complete len:214 (+) Transcript_82138:152-793(+)